MGHGCAGVRIVKEWNCKLCQKQSNQEIIQILNKQVNKIKLRVVVVSRMILELKRTNSRNLPSRSPPSVLSCRKNIKSRKFSKNPDFLTEITSIMDQAKQFSSTLNLEFRKFTDKPEKQLVYVEAPQVERRLQQMQARINSNKYQTVVQVRRDAVDSLSSRKKNGKDLMDQKNYNSIYTQYLRNLKKPNVIENTNNSTVVSQFTYQDEQINWGHELKSKLANSRLIINEKQNKINQQSEKKLTEEETLNTSTSYFCNSEEQEQNKRMYQLIAIRNHMYGNNKVSLRPETIMATRMERKFYRCKRQNMQNMFDRLENNKVESQPYFQTLDMKRTASEKKKNINSLILESCKRIYKEQNKILQKNLKKGLSKENTKNLILQFNKTILDMRAHTIQKTSRKPNPKDKNKKELS